MKSSELMIGDWVMYDEFIDKSMNHPIKITHLDKNSILTKQYYPIPLTPEILEKNGLETDDGQIFGECLSARFQ